jgi:hypothetical protein
LDQLARVSISAGYVGRGQEEKALRAREAGFLTKTYQVRDLAAKLREDGPG